MPSRVKLGAKRALAAVVAPLQRRLSALSAAIGSLEARLTGLEPRVDRLEPRVGGLEPRVDRLELRLDGLPGRVDELEQGQRTLRASMEDLSLRLPAGEEFSALMANISRQHAMFRQMRRDVDRALEDLSTVATNHDSAIKSAWETEARIQSDLSALERRVELVRNEIMYEIRYGRHEVGPAVVVEPKVLTPGCLDGDPIRLNLGSGLLPREGYVNVDRREIPGVDVVAEVSNLPVDGGTVEEIFSSHLLEHFPEEQLKRLLAYWVGLLREGGTFRAILPDGEAMIAEFSRGEFPWDQLRRTTFGGQEYDGDFHFAMYSHDDIVNLLSGASLSEVRLVDAGRPNGDCLEMEVVASKPALPA